jgi:hypothetical protein
VGFVVDLEGSWTFVGRKDSRRELLEDFPGGNGERKALGWKGELMKGMTSSCAASFEDFEV